MCWWRRPWQLGPRDESSWDSGRISSKIKAKTLSLNWDNYICETKLDLQRVPRNHEPTLQHFEVPQEYVRSLNATKLEQVFAKPFLASLDGHWDGVSCWAKHPESLANILSRACDGDRLKFETSLDENILVQYKHIKVFLYREYVLTFVGLHFFTVDDDKTAKQWKMDGLSYGEEEEPLPTILGKIAYTGIDHHWKKSCFATCGQEVDTWDEQRTNPICSMTWGFHHISSVKFNPTETLLLWSCSDRNIALYDMRKATPLKKVILDMRTNTIFWNPLEAFVFTAAKFNWCWYYV